MDHPHTYLQTDDSPDIVIVKSGAPAPSQETLDWLGRECAGAWRWREDGAFNVQFAFADPDDGARFAAQFGARPLGSEPETEAATDFDGRQAYRKRVLQRVMLAAQVLTVVYLATHAMIAWQAWRIDGLVAAIATFVLLGFGDLYWGLRWAYDGANPGLATVALLTAATCFASWATRGAFNRWVNGFTADMLKDFGGELERISAATRREQEQETADAADLGHSGPEPSSADPAGGAPRPNPDRAGPDVNGSRGS